MQELVSFIKVWSLIVNSESSLCNFVTLDFDAWKTTSSISTVPIFLMWEDHMLKAAGSWSYMLGALSVKQMLQTNFYLGTALPSLPHPSIEVSLGVS